MRDASWIPDASGTLKTPAESHRDDLADGFPIGNSDEAFLAAIGFEASTVERKQQAKEAREAAQRLGLERLPQGLIDELKDASPEDADRALKALREARAEREFPERKSRSPDRRKARVGERAAEADGKIFEHRARSVRVSERGSKEEARAYLRDMYTEDEELYCQVCEEPMPFLLRDGSPFFFVVQLLGDLDTEHRENYLCLCPVCAAKRRYACETDDDDLRFDVETTDSLKVEIELAGEPTTIRFVETHLEDLRAVLEALD